MGVAEPGLQGPEAPEWFGPSRGRRLGEMREACLRGGEEGLPQGGGREGATPSHGGDGDGEGSLKVGGST